MGRRYIDKDDLISEINKRIKILQNHPKENHKTICHLDSLKQSLNTLEVKEISDEYDGFLGKELKMVDDEIERLEKLKVKEVDLEEALSNLDKDIKEFVTTEEFENESTTAGHYWVIAKHAFLLGLKAQKGEEVWNI